MKYLNTWQDRAGKNVDVDGHKHTKAEIIDFPTIPTNTNQLTNGSGFITSSASITGNAATATKLQTARTINGVSFNGTANITITANPNAHTHTKSQITDMPTKLSQFTNDLSMGLIQTVSTTAPSSPSFGQVWIQLT